MNIYLILFFLATGFFAGYKGWFKRITNRIIDWGLIILLMVMGARMGIDDNILHQIHTLGIQAICFALASIIFSILIVKIISVFISTEGKTETEINADGGGDKIMYQIGISVFVGVIVGMFLLPESFLTYI